MTDPTLHRLPWTGRPPGTPPAAAPVGGFTPPARTSMLRTWYARCGARLRDHAHIVVDIHAPTADLDCQACHQRWPCHPYSAALSTITSRADEGPADHSAAATDKDSR